MIYKFKNGNFEMEVEKVSDDTLTIGTRDDDFDSEKKFHTMYLTKEDVYHLIGALHLLHKEMK